MIIDDTRLAAYLEGRLDGAERAQVDAALKSDPLLAARLGRLSAHRDRLSEADAHLSENLMAAGARAGRDNVVRLADRRTPPAPVRPKITLKWPAWGGLAAMFVAGLALGYGAARETGGPLTARADGMLAARGELVRVLNENRSGQPGPIRVGLSFMTADHRYCRTFQADAQRLAGIACHEGAGWVARMTTTVTYAQGGRSMASNTPLSVLAAADGMMAGERLDPSAEAMARARGWKD